jgi:hypothetical protein
MFELEFDGAFSRLSVKAPEFGPLFQLPPRMKPTTSGEPVEKSELRMPSYEPRLPSAHICMSAFTILPPYYTE